MWPDQNFPSNKSNWLLVSGDQFGFCPVWGRVCGRPAHTTLKYDWALWCHTFLLLSPPTTVSPTHTRACEAKRQKYRPIRCNDSLKIKQKNQRKCSFTNQTSLERRERDEVPQVAEEEHVPGTGRNHRGPGAPRYRWSLRRFQNQSSSACCYGYLQVNAPCAQTIIFLMFQPIRAQDSYSTEHSLSSWPLTSVVQPPCKPSLQRQGRRWQLFPVEGAGPQTFTWSKG